MKTLPPEPTNGGWLGWKFGRCLQGDILGFVEKLARDYPDLAYFRTGPIQNAAPVERHDLLAMLLEARDGEAGGAGLLLRAVPVKSAGTSRVYGGFIYAQLRDARTGESIDARVPESLAREIEWNREAVFVGLLRFKAGRGGVLKPEFRIDSVQQAGTARLPCKAELLEHWAEAAGRPKRDVRAALQVERPRLVIITGVTSVAVDDIRSQLREAEADLDRQVVRVSMSQPAEVMRALRTASDAQVVVLTRGGGESVHVLDNEDLIRAVAESPVPVAVASHRQLVDQVQWTLAA